MCVSCIQTRCVRLLRDGGSCGRGISITQASSLCQGLHIMLIGLKEILEYLTKNKINTILPQLHNLKASD